LTLEAALRDGLPANPLSTLLIEADSALELVFSGLDVCLRNGSAVKEKKMPP